MNQPDGPDDLDPFLRRFFQGEMPDPWPACPVPPGSAEPARVVLPEKEKPAGSWLEFSQRFASRLALALSLLLLLGGSWLLSDLFLAPATPADPTPVVRGDNPNVFIPDNGMAERQGVANGKAVHIKERIVVPAKDNKAQYQIEIHELPPAPRR